MATILPRSLSAKIHGSFAYNTMKDRLPSILSKVVDYLHRNRDNFTVKYGKDSADKVKAFIGYISKLRNEVQTDKPVLPLKDNGEDVIIWNNYLENYIKMNQRSPSSFQDPWLYIECYIYRKIQEASVLSGMSHDVFFNMKCDSFETSKEPIEILSQYFCLNISLAKIDVHKAKDMFCCLLKTSLWGNKCDLSISGMEANSQKCDPMQQLLELEPNILINDWSKVYDHINSSRWSHSAVNIDFVLDNAGFELFTDIIFALFLLECGFANYINFHVKNIPWFISDVTFTDFEWFKMQLKALSNDSSSHAIYKLLESAIYQDKIKLKADIFWTMPFAFFEMPTYAPNLYSELCNSQLVIFKGDLNYRKLVADLEWKPDTKFCDALQGFNPSLVALRTLKANVITGIMSDVSEDLNSRIPDWMITGNYGVVQANLCQK